MAGATNGGDPARFCPLELDLAPRKKNGERNGKLRASTRIRAPTPRSGAIADAWSGADEHRRRYGRRASQWKRCRYSELI